MVVYRDCTYLCNKLILNNYIPGVHANFVFMLINLYNLLHDQRLFWPTKDVVGLSLYFKILWVTFICYFTATLMLIFTETLVSILFPCSIVTCFYQWLITWVYMYIYIYIYIIVYLITWLFVRVHIIFYFYGNINITCIFIYCYYLMNVHCYGASS